MKKSHYIKITGEKVSYSREISECKVPRCKKCHITLVVDYDKDNHPVGIEIVGTEIKNES